MKVYYKFNADVINPDRKTCCELNKEFLQPQWWTGIMTKEEEIPDWVGAQEFYDKYEPKEILGRYDYKVLN